MESRYMKYVEIVYTIDETLKKKTAGKVDIDKDLPKIKALLEVQKLALEMGMCIDRIDDGIKTAFKLYAQGDPSARGVIEGVMDKRKGMGGEQQEESASGRDFRRGREDSESDRSYSARHWAEEERTDAAYGRPRGEEMSYGHNDEARLGRSRRTGRFVHRAEMDDDPRDFFPMRLPFGMTMPDTEARMGFFDSSRVQKAPYGHLPFVNINTNGGLVEPLIKAPNAEESAVAANPATRENIATATNEAVAAK